MPIYNEVMTKLFLLLLMTILAGCLTPESITKRYSELDYSDGVSQEEAKIIAQKYCLEDADCYTQAVVSSAQVKEFFPDPELWRVRFDSKITSENFALPLSLKIDKKTGEIVEFGVWK